MKLKLFGKKRFVSQYEKDHQTTMRSPPTVDVPEFSVGYCKCSPTHIILNPHWIASDGTYFRQDEGVRIFNCIKSHYDELKSWRITDSYCISTYKPLPANLDMETIIELVGAVQIVIKDMLDDWLYYRDMVMAHKDK